MHKLPPLRYEQWIWHQIPDGIYLFTFSVICLFLTFSLIPSMSLPSYPTLPEMENEYIHVKMTFSIPMLTNSRSKILRRCPGLCKVLLSTPSHIRLNHPAKRALVWREALKLTFCAYKRHTGWLQTSPPFVINYSHTYSKPQLLKSIKVSLLLLKTLWLSPSKRHTQTLKDTTWS